MGKWSIKKFLLGFLILIIFAILSKVCFGYYPKQNIINMLSSDIKLPSEWSTGEVVAKDINWVVIKTYIKEKSEIKTGAINECYRIWSVDNEHLGQKVVQSISQFSSPLIAEVSFWLNRPELYHYYHLPNFMGTLCEDKKDCYSESIDFPTVNADQVVIVCGMGKPEDCQYWFYWARYGQYIVKTTFFAPNQGWDENLFLNLVKEIDQDFYQRVSTR